MRTRFAALFLAFGWIVVTGQPAGATPDPLVDVDQAADQRMFPDGRCIDFGTVLPWQTVDRAFRIVNRSATPLRILNVRRGG